MKVLQDTSVAILILSHLRNNPDTNECTVSILCQFQYQYQCQYISQYNGFYRCANVKNMADTDADINVGASLETAHLYYHHIVDTFHYHPALYGIYIEMAQNNVLSFTKLLFESQVYDYVGSGTFY